jgi:hypothetical protein
MTGVPTQEQDAQRRTVCANCKFWQTVPNKKGGHCHAIPPHPLTGFPGTKPMDWCGHFAFPAELDLLRAEVAILHELMRRHPVP